MSEWYAEERFWKVLYTFLFGEDRFREAEEHAGPLVEFLGLQAGQSVLDLCCGPGRFAIPLASRDIGVTGVDRSAFLLGRARSKAKERGVEVEWVESDMRRFVRKEAFDAVLNLFTSFGYFADEQDDVLVLANVLQSLKPGGTLLMDLSCKEQVAKVFQPVHAEEVEDGAILVQKHRIADGWDRIENEWILIGTDDTVERFHFSHRLYSGRELADRMRSVGFADVHLMGGPDGRPFDHEAQRLVVTARRPQ